MLGGMLSALNIFIYFPLTEAHDVGTTTDFYFEMRKVKLREVGRIYIVKATQIIRFESGTGFKACIPNQNTTLPLIILLPHL